MPDPSYANFKSGDAFYGNASATYDNAVVVGSCLVAFFHCSTTPGTPPTVADNVNAGNWTEDTNSPVASGGARIYAFTKKNTGAGTPTVTCTVSGVVGRLMVCEVKDADTTSPVETSNKEAGGPVNSGDCGDLTTAGAAVLVQSFEATGSNYPTALDGQTKTSPDTDYGGNKAAHGYEAVASGGTYTTGWDFQDSNYYWGIALAIKGAAGGDVTVTNPQASGAGSAPSALTIDLGAGSAAGAGSAPGSIDVGVGAVAQAAASALESFLLDLVLRAEGVGSAPGGSVDREVPLDAATAAGSLLMGSYLLDLVPDIVSAVLTASGNLELELTVTQAEAAIAALLGSVQQGTWIEGLVATGSGISLLGEIALELTVGVVSGAGVALETIVLELTPAQAQAVLVALIGSVTSDAAPVALGLVALEGASEWRSLEHESEWRPIDHAGEVL